MIKSFEGTETNLAHVPGDAGVYASEKANSSVRGGIVGPTCMDEDRVNLRLLR